MTKARPVVYLIGFAAPPVLHLHEFVMILVAKGWDPWVVLSPIAASWADTPQLTAASSHQVRVEPRRPSEPKPLPPAAAVVAAPLTFNSVNKWAAGISDTLALGLLNEALGQGLTIIAAPFVQSALRRHPAYQNSIDILMTAGVAMANTDEVAQRASSGVFNFDWSRLVPTPR